MKATPLVAQPTPKGQLFLVPSTLDFGVAEHTALNAVLPEQTLVTAARLRHWVCENAKSTRAFLKRVHESHPLATPLQEQQFVELPREVHKKGDHTGQFDARPLLAPALTGHDMGLVSEAGMPAVADPGSSVVRAAHDLGLGVVPLVGPVSLLLALAASGLNGQNFAFVGYLPHDAIQRQRRIRELESLAVQTTQTQLFIETPYRNPAMLATLVQSLKPSTRLAVCSGLTLPKMSIHSARVKDWSLDTWQIDARTPTVFAIGI